MPSSSSRSKPKPSEVASEAKRHYIPLIRTQYASIWATSSYMIHHPLQQITFLDRPLDVTPPVFCVTVGDPVDFAIGWGEGTQSPVPFICPANDRRPGGDWDTGVVGYEERLCRRSTLAACLSTPEDGSSVNGHYPLPISAVIVSRDVVVFRGPHDTYDKRAPDAWRALPVVSVPPPRWPKLTQNGTKYSFADERDMVKEKLRGALRICAYNNYSTIVIGDFGLGNGYRNPPQELAELWREVFLYDPDLRGRIKNVAFVFEDPTQSTAQLILDDMAKKARSNGSSASGRSKAKGSSLGSALGSSAAKISTTDYQIFKQVFDHTEVQRFLGQPDPRYELSTLIA